MNEQRSGQAAYIDRVRECVPDARAEQDLMEKGGLARCSRAVRKCSTTCKKQEDHWDPGPGVEAPLVPQEPGDRETLREREIEEKGKILKAHYK